MGETPKTALAPLKKPEFGIIQKLQALKIEHLIDFCTSLLLQ